MATFTVNGQTVTVEQNQKLMRYLRDTLHLTSVKAVSYTHLTLPTN